jgi:hypothetical protein
MLARCRAEQMVAKSLDARLLMQDMVVFAKKDRSHKRGKHV